MTVEAVQRKLPGDPMPPEEVLRSYNEGNSKRRAAIAEEFGPQSGVLWPFWAPDPDQMWRWRYQLDCGHIRETLTRGEGHPPLGGESVRVRHGDEIVREELPPGHAFCGSDQSRRKVLRDIAEWKRRHDEPYVDDGSCMEWSQDEWTPEQWAQIQAVEARMRRPRAKWDVVLSCGHQTVELTEVDWKPEDGIERTSTGCTPCSLSRRITAYESLGPLVAPPPPPPKPRDPRKSLERRILEAERTARRLQKELDALNADLT